MCTCANALFSLQVPERTNEIQDDLQTHLKTQFPISSTFHARTNATSPLMASSRMYRRPFHTLHSFLLPSMRIPADTPPGL